MVQPLRASARGMESRKVTLFSTDVGEHIPAQEGHAVTPLELSKIIELAPSFMCVLRGPTFVFEVANEAYRQLAAQRELIGLSVREALPEVEGQGFFELLERVYSTGEPWVGNSIPVRLRRNPGGEPEERYLDLVYQALRGPEGAITSIFVHGVDITSRRLAEDALRTTAELAERQARVFNTTLSAITDFAYSFDRNGRFVYANKPLLDLWGLTLEEACGKNFFDLKYPDDLAAKLQRQIQHVFDTHEGVIDETPYTSPTGVDGYYEYIFRPVYDLQGEVELVAGSTRDITLRKHSEDALKDADRRKSEFLAILVHELRNPLAPIRSAVEFLEKNTTSRDAARPLYQMMERHVSLMVRLIDDLLDLSRVARGTIELRCEQVELSTVLQQAVEIVQAPCAESNHDLTVTMPAEPI